MTSCVLQGNEVDAKYLMPKSSDKTVAGKHFVDMDADKRAMVEDHVDVSLMKDIRSKVKSSVIQVEYADRCKAALVKHLTETQSRVEDMVHAKVKTVWERFGALATLRVGEWVDVQYEYCPGVTSDGGVGAIVNINDPVDRDEGDPTIEGAQTVDVLYLLGGRTEKRITLTRITVIPMPFMQPGGVSLRPRISKEVVEESPGTRNNLTKRTPIEWLKFGLESRRHEQGGWLRDLLERAGEIKKGDKSTLWNSVMQTYNCQLACIEGMRAMAGGDFVDPRKYRGLKGRNSGGKFVSAKTASQVGIPKNFLTIPYLLKAYDVKRGSFLNYRKAGSRSNALLSKEEKSARVKGRNVITCRETAKARYSVKYFYVRERMAHFSGDDGNGKSKAGREKKWGKGWDDIQKLAAQGATDLGLPSYMHSKNANLTIGDFITLLVPTFEYEAREHDARQPLIIGHITAALEANVCRSVDKFKVGWLHSRIFS